VHGSVLIQHGVAYFAAGRSSYLDGGVLLYGLDPASGKVLCRSRIQSGHAQPVDPSAVKDAAGMAEKIVQNAADYKTFVAPDRSDAFSMSGVTTDVLVSDGTSIYLRHLRFDRSGVRQPSRGRHLFSTSGLLDDAENHRSHWALGTGDFSRMPVAYSWIVYNPNRFGWRISVPSGLMLAFDQKTVWGVRRVREATYALFANEHEPLGTGGAQLPDFRRASEENVPSFRWSVPLAMRPRTLVQAGAKLVLGGTPPVTDQAELAAVYAGRKGGVLWVFAAADGEKLAQYPLDAPPVWDGMAAAGGRLYLSTTSGKVACFAGPPAPRSR
jgi:outer membrane protein assembly factor BamB